MSGITGIFRRNGQDVDPADIKKMNDKIAHRGPDGSRVWCEGPVAFGHQMLHTTPESLHETLPFDDEESGLVITADARIDNRKDLAPLLGIEDNEYVSDSYFILKAYEKWGEKCPEELLGDFAFAIWDKNKEELFCARDHMGVKPLYFYYDDESFVFATEIKSILSILKINPPINKFKLSNFLSLLFTERKSTFYKNISALPAAYYLNVDQKNKSLIQYWELNIENEIHYDSTDQYITEFFKIFNESVNCRLRSAFPVGSMLSGGLDSSSIACTAQKVFNTSKTNLKTFSAIFDSVPDSNERKYIEKLISFSGFEPYFINADEISPLEEIDEILYFADQPSIFPNTFMSWNIYRKANENGVRILLDGLEGDVTVSHGDGYLSELARSFRWKKLLSEINHTSKRLGISRYKIFRQIALKNLIPYSIKLKLSPFLNKKKNSRIQFVKREFAESTQLMDRWQEIYEKNLQVSTAHKKHYNSLRSAFFQYELEAVDSISAPFFIELRHPFFDKRLIEFCLAIPTEQKFVNGWDRLILRRAMSKILPKEIQWRENKGDLSYNFDKSLIKYGKDVIDESIIENNYLIEDYVDVQKLSILYNNYLNGSNSRDSIYIWNSVILSLWLRKNGLK